jgi:hypothetical protein
VVKVSVKSQNNKYLTIEGVQRKIWVSTDRKKGKLRINITSISTRCGYCAGSENLNCVSNQVVGGPFIAVDDALQKTTKSTRAKTLVDKSKDIVGS